MPTSWPSQISPILNIILAASPRSVLDIGCGYGKYGVLCREYLDVMEGARAGDLYPPRRRVTIDCIEACAEYISPVHRHVYDSIQVGDALKILPTLGDSSYDLALVVDVLEHFSPEEGGRFVGEVIRVARVALVATPTTPMPQSATFGNEYERHRSYWTGRKLRAMAPASRFFRTVASSTGHICLLSRDPRALGEIARHVQRQNWISLRTAMLECLHLRTPLRRLLGRHVDLEGV